MVVEELLIKMGVDTSQVAPNILGARVAVENSAKKMEEGFLHVGSAGKAFHRLLEKITEASPIAGTAITAMLNPLVAGLALGAMGLAAMTKKLEEWNEKLEKTAELNAHAFFDLPKLMHDVTASLEQATRSFKDFIDVHDKPRDKGLEDLRTELTLLKSQHDVREKMIQQDVQEGRTSAAQGKQLQYENDLKLAQRRFDTLARVTRDKQVGSEAARLDAINAFDAAHEPGRAKSIEKAKGMLEFLNRQTGPLEDEQIKAAIAAGDTSFGMGATGPFGIPNRPLQTTKEEAEAKKWTDALAKNKAEIERVTKSLEGLTTSQDGADRQLKIAEEAFSQAHDTFTDLTKQTKEARDALQALKLAGPQLGGPNVVNTRDIPSIDQLARSGSWFRNQMTAFQWRWRPGRFAGLAQEYQNLGFQAADVASGGLDIPGNLAAYNNIQGRKDRLAGILRDAGLLPQEELQAQMAKSLADMEAVFKAVAEGKSSFTVVAGDDSGSTSTPTTK